MRDDLIQRIDMASSRVKPYEGFIFLCGGPTDGKSHTPISVRDAIYRELIKNPEIEKRIAVAEHFKDWSHDATYRDLMMFEKHLAELSSVIVLVLESPGSLAELGLFAVIKEFQEKLLVFIETEHYQAPSFIRFGPIDYLEKQHNNLASCHNWFTKDYGISKFDATLAVGLQQELAEAVLERVNTPTKERLFSNSEWRDVTLLICDLINLNVALTLREIRDSSTSLGVIKSEPEIRQSLFLLEKLRLIAMQPKGTQRFYVCNQPHQFLQYHIEDKSFDLMRFRSNVLEQYDQKDKKRFNAIRDARGQHA